LLLALGLVAAPAAAQAPERRFTVGVKAGAVTPGAFYWHEGPYESYELRFSLSAGLFADMHLANNLSAGLYSDSHFINAFDGSSMLLDLGLAFKATVASKAGKPVWRPLVALGFGHMGGIYLLDASSYFTMKGGVEVMIPAGARRWLVEALVFGSPNGGNDGATMTFGPVFMARAGFVL
jgi:hypothetical protein